MTEENAVYAVWRHYQTMEKTPTGWHAPVFLPNLEPTMFLMGIRETLGEAFKLAATVEAMDDKDNCVMVQKFWTDGSRKRSEPFCVKHHDEADEGKFAEPWAILEHWSE